MEKLIKKRNVPQKLSPHSKRWNCTGLAEGKLARQCLSLVGDDFIIVDLDLVLSFYQA